MLGEIPHVGLFFFCLLRIFQRPTDSQAAVRQKQMSDRSAQSFTCNVCNQANHQWFELIASGAKTAEGRLYKGKWQQMKVGDYLHATEPSSGRSLLLRITELSRCRSLHDMAERYGRALAPHLNDCERIVNAYRTLIDSIVDGNTTLLNEGMIVVHFVLEDAQ